MTFNLLEEFALHRARSASQKSWEEHHWAAHYGFGVPRDSGPPLVFEIRMPDGLEMVDAVALAQAARGAPAWVGNALTGLQQAVELPGVVVIGALRGTATPEAQREVVATLTVTFVDTDDPVDIEALMPKDSASTIQSQQDHHQLSDHMWRIHRISGESQGEGKDPLPVLLIEYVWKTTYGVVTMAFATTRVDMMGEKASELFDQIRQSAYIGEQPSIAA
ncbi:MAG TPA: hypothetical protein VMF14_09360 [Solirubrobacteraceae bacterium]|nr:hypothetical protein [Solirubrobacteraceae bacterium]